MLVQVMQTNVCIDEPFLIVRSRMYCLNQLVPFLSGEAEAL